MEADELIDLLKQPESEILEFKNAITQPENIAKMIAGMANTRGGYIIFGVTESRSDTVKLRGIATNSPAQRTINKAVSQLTPQPFVEHYPFWIHGTLLYVVRIEKGKTLIYTNEGKIFTRLGAETRLLTSYETNNKSSDLIEIRNISYAVTSSKKTGTPMKDWYLEHCQTLLNLIDFSKNILVSSGIDKNTTILEGKLLNRLLYASLIDMFEKYLSDLIFEIYLTKPETLLAGTDENQNNPTDKRRQVPLKDVLVCSDIDDFVKQEAIRRVSKLSKGSVKSFINENQQIKSLNIFDEQLTTQMETLFQIRHLYTHRNGVIDNKFIKSTHFSHKEGSEHQFSLLEIINTIVFLQGVIEGLDSAAINKYSLSLA